MTETRPLEEVRLTNLKFLHGSVANFGAPTSGGLASFLNSKKVKITEQQLSDIYHRKKNIDMILALSIEKAFSLPNGWLSEDQSYFLKLSPEEKNNS
jgi:hypothetical protein